MVSKHKKAKENIQVVMDAINYAENEENASYVITTDDKVLIKEALELL